MSTLQHHHPGIWTIPGFLSSEECQHWIDHAENNGFEAAGITVGRSQVMNTHVRNNDRYIEDNKDLALEMYRRARPFLPDDREISDLSGLNPRWRFYRYGVKQRFRMHQDGSYIQNINRWSEYTFLIYLNDDVEGGATNFARGISIQPETGALLIFKHELLHEGAKITNGVKYVMRTDVMYRRKKK